MIGGEHGILFSEGAQWKRHRKLISGAFHFEFLKKMIPTIVTTTNEVFTDEIDAHIDKKIDLMEMFESITG